LLELEHSRAYVIGGLVDHNRLKRISIDFAESHGLVAKRLPLGFLKLKSNCHFAVNHVLALVGRVAEGETWETAAKVIPQRKL
jgi:tRNA (guanine9-N1)-methyltransferase